jgi:hypothetical protein
MVLERFPVSNVLVVFSILLLVGFFYFPLPVQCYGSNGGMMSAYGGSQDDWAYSIVLTKDIGLAMAGFTKSYGAGGSDMWLIRTVLKAVPWGNVTTAFQANAWNKTYGGPQDDVAKQVIQTSDGGFALAGYTNSSGAGD